jgi:hypothetical protein
MGPFGVRLIGADDTEGALAVFLGAERCGIAHAQKVGEVRR